MEPRKWAMVTGVLLIGIISGNLAQSSGRSAKILEDPTIPHLRTSHDIPSALQDTSNRSLSQGNNMMLYRTVFTLSLKLLTIFLIVKLFGGTLTGSGVLRSQRPGQIVAFQPGAAGGAGASGGYGEYGSGMQGQQQQYQTVDVNHNPGATLITATSTGAAAGASTGGAAGVGLGAGTIPVGGFLSTAAANPRPSFLHPRFRFGGPRYPPPRQAFPPPQMMMGYPVQTQHNMGTETHVVETHSHMYVLPDGTQTKIPAAPQGVSTPIKTDEASSSDNAASSSTPEQSQQTDAKSSSSDVTAESSKVETVVSSSSSSSTSPQVAERRSSLAYRDKLHQLQQAYEDWNLHFNPGTRSL